MLKKIKDYESMAPEEIIILLGGNNREVLGFLCSLWTDIGTMRLIGCLAKIGITGSYITYLYKMICKGSMERFYITCNMLAQGTYTDEEIEKNITSIFPVPFYDETIESRETIKYLAPDDEESEVWKELCKRQRKNYIDKYGDPSTGDPQSDFLGKGRTTK